MLMPTNTPGIEVIQAFFPNAKDYRLAPFGAGLINDTYRVRPAGEERDWLLQRLNHFVFRRPQVVMDNIAKIADHLATQDYTGVILQPLRTQSGALLHRDEEGNYWRVFPFFANAFSIDQAAQPEQVFQAGRAYGLFSHALASLDPKVAGIGETIPGFHDSVGRLPAFEAALDNSPGTRPRNAANEIADMREYQSLFYEIDNLGLPRRITHNDTKINNVLFDEETGAVRGVIDWDTIMPGTLLSDFGDMVRTMTPNYDENYQKAEEIEVVADYFEALCQGFLPAVEDILTSAEKENLVRAGQWITLEQALRFLTDYLNGDVYYKTNFPEQNLLRTRNQLVLFRALRKAEPTLVRMIDRVL